MRVDDEPMGVEDPTSLDIPVRVDMTVGVAELHELLRGAVRQAGLDHLWVTGVVSGLRRGPKFTSWELVEYQPDATTVRAVLHVGAFPRESPTSSGC